MEGLKAKLVPLPKYVERLGGGDDNELASCGVVDEVLVCAVLPPDLPQPLHAGLLDVARHLKRALEVPDFHLHPHLHASFSLPTSSSPSLSTSSSSDHISAFYLRLETGGAIDEAATALVRPLLPPSSDELVEGEPEGYTLRVVAPVPAQGQPGRVEVTGRTCRGAFYGAQTLVQLLRAFNWGGSPRQLRLPLVSIADQPDFAARGVMLDVSRDKVPTVETVKRMVDELASLKVNQLQLYIEHTFAYPGHEQVWRDASPFTAEDILELDAYCRERFVELVPNQNSFGHFHRWLKHPTYRKYAEVPEGNLHPFLAVGDENEKEPFGLAPDDQSLALLDELYAALLPNFSSRQFNVGCDETFDLGQGRSKQLCEEKGVQTVYIDFLNRVNELVSKKYRKKMQYWGDIVLQQPDLIHTLPKDAIALIWGYEASHPFAEQCKAFAALKEIPFYVCPGTSSWNTVVGRTDNAVANLVSAAHHGRENGAVGYLVTDWGDNGHWQTLPVSYLGFMAGAGLAWNAEANDVRSYLSREHLASRLNMHVFHDTADLLGGIVYDLGCLYTVTGGEPQCNDSCIFKFLQNPTEDNRRGVTVASAEAAHERIVAAMAALRKVHAARDDAQLVIEEVAHGAAMADVSCRAMALSLRAAPAQTTAEEWREVQEAWAACKRHHEAIWLRRNRPGGLVDSLKRFTPLARFLAANSAQS